MSKKNKKLNIAIIGYGRFGRLLVEILLPYGKIHIISGQKIKSGRLKQISYPDLTRMDWVIPAVPISAMAGTLKKMNMFISGGCLVMDVCSVKVLPCRWLEKIIKKEVNIIGSHPMFGPDSAKNGLTGLQMVICPIRQSRENLILVKDIFKKMGLKIIITSPAEHDKQAARSLALVHFIGRGLSKIKINSQQITTVGFNRLLAVNETVSHDTWQLFLDMQNYNPYAGKTRNQFVKSLENIEKQIQKQK